MLETQRRILAPLQLPTMEDTKSAPVTEPPCTVMSSVTAALTEKPSTPP